MWHGKIEMPSPWAGGDGKGLTTEVHFQPTACFPPIVGISSKSYNYYYYASNIHQSLILLLHYAWVVVLWKCYKADKTVQHYGLKEIDSIISEQPTLL